MIDHAKEIYSRPKKTWFQSEKEKLHSKKNSELSIFGAEEKSKKDSSSYFLFYFIFNFYLFLF